MLTPARNLQRATAADLEREAENMRENCYMDQMSDKARMDVNSLLF